MAGLVPAIHVLLATKRDVDARHKAGHDDGERGVSATNAGVKIAGMLE
jgi:hypothetical protein